MNNIGKKYSLKSPAVKRLMREAAELNEPTTQYSAQPLEDNLFEWHFTVRGPPDTEFASGRYHGRIILPPEYPMKPPNIILITPNGRFELGKKICLSMSAHHPETWQPSWSIRTVLLALIGFMPTKGGGAIGALDYTSEERKALAIKSQTWKCDICGAQSETCLVEGATEENDEMNEAKELASQIDFKGETDKKKQLSESPTSNPQPQPPVQDNTTTTTTNMNEQAYNEHMAKLYSMYNQHGAGYPQQGQFSSPPGWPSTPENNPSVQPPCQSQATISSDSIPPQSGTSPVTDENSTETSLRQRVISSQNNSQSQEASSNSSSSTPENVIQPRPNETYNSTLDTITVTLMWIITAILLVFILRRLAMEGASISKT